MLRTAATVLASVAAGLPVAGVVIWVRQTPAGPGTSLVLGALGLSAVANIVGFSRIRSSIERHLEGILLARRPLRNPQHRQGPMSAAQQRVTCAAPAEEPPGIWQRASAMQHVQGARATTVRFREQLGTSPAVQEALAPIDRAAPTDTSILITGETGLGKELIARAIHARSPRRGGPFIAVHCPSLVADLADSELFGCDGTVLNGAREATGIGKIERAHGGTLFLDEVAQLPRQIQAKLARVLEEREVQRAGSERISRPSFRVVATSTCDLQVEMRAGRFRKDLYYRVAVVVVHVPPLRERPEDIPTLASVFLKHAATADHKSIRGFTAAALAALSRYSWPGNLRELQHVIGRAALLCTSDMIQAEHLGELAVGGMSAPPRHRLGLTQREEKLRSIEQALAQTGGNHAAAARLLGMSPTSLARLIRNFGLKPPPLLQ